MTQLVVICSETVRWHEKQVRDLPGESQLAADICEAHGQGFHLERWGSSPIPSFVFFP